MADWEITDARLDLALHSFGKSSLSPLQSKSVINELLSVGNRHPRASTVSCVPFHSQRRRLSDANHQPAHRFCEYSIPRILHRHPNVNYAPRVFSICVGRSQMPLGRSKVIHPPCSELPRRRAVFQYGCRSHSSLWSRRSSVSYRHLGNSSASNTDNTRVSVIVVPYIPPANGVGDTPPLPYYLCVLASSPHTSVTKAEFNI